LENLLKKDMDLNHLKELLLSDFRDNYEIVLKEELKNANSELDLILESTSEEYKIQEMKIKEI
jgi:hypothetical protein